MHLECLCVWVYMLWVHGVKMSIYQMCMLSGEPLFSQMLLVSPALWHFIWRWTNVPLHRTKSLRELPREMKGWLNSIPANSHNWEMAFVLARIDCMHLVAVKWLIGNIGEFVVEWSRLVQHLHVTLSSEHFLKIHLKNSVNDASCHKTSNKYKMLKPRRKPISSLIRRA